MSPFLNQDDDDRDETGPQGQGLHVEVEEKVCRDCRREVPAWIRTCPECGGDVVPRTALPAPHDALLQRFTDADDDDAGGGNGGGDGSASGSAAGSAAD